MGIALIILLLTLVNVITTFINPQIKTIASASCHVNPIAAQIVYVNSALIPKPALCTYGTLATKPKNSVPNADANIVAPYTAL